VRYSLSRGIELRRSDSGGSGILVDLASGACFHLNASGLETVEGLRRGEDSRQVAAGLAARTGAAEATVQGDVQALVTELVREGLLVAARS